MKKNTEANRNMKIFKMNLDKNANIPVRIDREYIHVGQNILCYFMKNRVKYYNGVKQCFD